MMMSQLLTSLCVYATSSDSIKFWVEVPDTLLYGEKAQITYHLHTNEFADAVFPKFENFKLMSLHYPPYESYSNLSRFRDFEWRMEVIPYKNGIIRIPAMSVIVGGNKTQSTGKTVFVKGRGNPNDALILKELQKYWRSNQSLKPDYSTHPIIKKHLGEAEIAKKWLESKKQKSTNIWLKEVYSNDHVVLFSDDWNMCFVLTATEKYQSFLDNIVLAYSLESNINWNVRLILSYSECLEKIKNDSLEGHIDKRFYTANSQEVKPLLGEMRWGQDAPYNAMLSKRKDGERRLLGPGAVACAQLMRYYQFPSAGTGYRLYIDNKVLFGNTDFSKTPFNWTEMQDFYQDDEDVPASLANLMSNCCYSLETRWPSTNATSSTGFRNFKAALIDYFGYNRSCRYVENLTGDATSSLLYRDLDNGHPILCKGLSNYFICDGYDGDFFHVNMGNKGFANGYYRMSLAHGESMSPMINAMIVGLKPDNGMQLSRNIQMKEAGMLSQLLTDEEKLTVTHLVLSGKMNADDIKVVRKMAGGVSSKRPAEQIGQLSSLDMSDIVFVEDEKAFLQKDASDYVYTKSSMGYEIDKKSLGNMSEEEWNKFLDESISKGSGYHLNYSKSGKRFIYFTLKNKTIAPYLFEDCDNLTEIRLPVKTMSIDDCAFRNCSSLKQIVLPPDLHVLTEGCFMQCYQLEKVLYQSKNGIVVKESKHGKLKISDEDAIEVIDKGPFMGNNKVMCRGLIEVE